MKRETTNEMVNKQLLDGQMLLKKLPDAQLFKKINELKKQIYSLNKQAPIIFVNIDLLNRKSIELFQLAKDNQLSVVFVNEESMLEQQVKKPTPSSIHLHLETGIQIIPFDDIIRLRANSNYTAFYTIHHTRPIITSKPLKFYVNQFNPSQFIRPHRSHLINKKFIKAYCNENGHHLILKNRESIEISRRKLKETLKQITSYI